MSKHSLFSDQQMTFEMPYVLNYSTEGISMVEAPDLFEGTHEPLVTYSTDEDEEWDVIGTYFYESGIYFDNLVDGVTLEEAQMIMMQRGYGFLYLTDQTDCDQVTPTGKYALVHGDRPVIS
ncbi:hypothetical protein ACTXIU_12970 [Glutamicibacter arilaitensis]|uniref:hypothetical protein n=1 Tax=Glutamicibacter arilaitensis TaxID=256701 RepID=UPI003FD1731C